MGRVRMFLLFRITGNFTPDSQLLPQHQIPCDP